MPTIIIGGKTANQEANDMALSVPVSDFSTDGLNHCIDSRKSTWNGSETGGSMGNHTFYFSGNKNKLDIDAESKDLTLLAGAAVKAIDDGFEKDVTGNTWNSYAYSEQSFNPNNTDFAVSWLVESVDGTIRELIGLDDNPTANKSYSSMEYALYQVNSNFYDSVYQKGARTVTGKGSIKIKVGDRLGIKCIDKTITYFIKSDNKYIDVYTSEIKAEKPLYLKIAFNRGNTSSGHSAVTNCKYHIKTNPANVNVRISGLATELISESDKNNLFDLGIFPSFNTTYSNFNFTRPVTDKFPANYSISYNHTYSVNEKQDVKTILFSS